MVDQIWCNTAIRIWYGSSSSMVRQERNPHDLWKDLDVERNGMILTDDFCEALRSVPLSGESYHQCFGELSQNLEPAWKAGSKWDQSQQEWRARFLEGLRIWHEVFELLGAGRVAAAAGA